MSISLLECCAKNAIIEFVEEKFERRLSEEISGLEIRLSEKINLVDKRLSKLEGSLDAKINTAKADLIKWMFIFWIGQVGVNLGILFAFYLKRGIIDEFIRCRNKR